MSELEQYDTSKGTIHFQAANPLPVGLVRKLIKARVAERLASQSQVDPRRERRPHRTDSTFNSARPARRSGRSP